MKSVINRIKRYSIISIASASMIFGIYYVGDNKVVNIGDTAQEVEVDVNQAVFDTGLKNSMDSTEENGTEIETITESSSENMVADNINRYSKTTIIGCDINTSGKVDLTFAKVNGAKSYRVYTSRFKNKGYKYVGASKDETFTDNAAPVNNYLYYRVKVVTGEGMGNFSEPLRVLALGKADDVKVKSSTKKNLVVSWKKVMGATGYIVYKSNQKNGVYKKVATVNGPSYTDGKVTKGKIYYYKVVAYSGSPSKVAFASDSAKGMCLKNPAITSISNTDKSRCLVIRWNKVKGAKAYNIIRESKSGKQKVVATVKGSKTSYVDKNKTGGRVYKYKIRAIDANGGYSHASHVVSQLAIDANKPMIALTYDDGPSAYTPLVLNAVKKYDAHVTFFLVGTQVEKFGDYIVEEKELGCEIGNHTWDHSMFKNLTYGQIDRKINKADNIIYKYIGEESTLTRPPGGGVEDDYLDRSKHPIVLWTIDTLDWQTKNTEKTKKAVFKYAEDGDIVLMHDLHESTALGADDIMKTLTEEGYQLVTVSEMAAYRSSGLKNNKKYFSFYK